MTDAEKIARLREALKPFAELLESPDEYHSESFDAYVLVADIKAAQIAMTETE